jgi:cyclopropane-fatty-acyl-phospholipid synthase
MEQRLRQAHLPVGVQLWNGAELVPGSPKVRVALRTPHAMYSLDRPTLGKLARAYVEQEIDLEGDMHDILSMGESLCDAAAAIGGKPNWLWKWWRHTGLADRRNISYHYDVSNDFYALWLDSRRVYSCAYFKHADDSLETAQEQKLEHICRKLMLKPGETLLDIGCGWGALILWAAEHYQVRATGITLSRNQHEYVEAQIAARGLQHLCSVRLMDYREVPDAEQYDKIASVGMFEHVGLGNLPLYFAKIHSLLKPGGLVMNHGITQTALDREGLGSDISEFVEQYVFPGGELVHLARVVETMAQQHLECLDAENLRPHYAKTLWHWAARLQAHQHDARELIGEKKYRIWQIYMMGSAHAFERNWLSLYQILAGKPMPDGSLPYPYTRDHVYVT